MSKEKKITFLTPETHQTILEVDVQAFRHNFRFFRSRLRKNTGIVAMVKAFAYGVGISKLARVLEEEGADYLAVAYIDEGVALRKIDIKAPIMVFNPEPSGFEDMLAYNLEPEVFSTQFLKTLHQFAKDKKLDKKLCVHLKLDTGMNRLGIKKEDLPELLKALVQALNYLDVVSIFSHMSASEMAIHDDFSTQQIVHFKEMAEPIQAALPKRAKEHILNTSGVERFPQAQLDMVRVGLGLFGLSYVPEVQKELKEVCVLKSRIAQIKTVNEGESIGYSRSFTAQKDMKIGIVFLGYADGLPRALSNGKGSLYVNGKLAPIVGNICMDITMIDLTEIEAKVSDEVTVFGGPINLFDFAGKLNTIPYEVLTDLSTRVRRVYVD